MPSRHTLVALLGLTLIAGAARAADLDDCNADVPVPAPAAPAPLEAYWLDARTVQWPGLKLQPGERVRLHHAKAAGLVAAPGGAVAGADGAVELVPSTAALPARFSFIGAGPRFALAAGADAASLLREQLLLVHEGVDGRVIAATGLQIPGALDELYAAAEKADDLGAHPAKGATRFAVWAPTAQRVLLCRHARGDAPAMAVDAMRLDPATGIWRAELPGDLSGQAYSYLVDVVAPGHGRVRNRVTDPYSVALTADSRLSVVADLASPRLKPPGWDKSRAPSRVKAATDQVIYELHVRDFSLTDASVRPAWRGKYLAFTEPRSNGMKHLKALSQAGMTDVHLLPVFDLASVPERGCKTPIVPSAAADSEAQQAAVMADAANDCFNWGYDPWHFNAPEGSYATDPLKRVVEFRQMVMGLHGAGLRVGMDMVYNHMAAAGQAQKSVLDRLVPGYYHRLNAKGDIERSTCCDNTATEHRMMAKLMIDSAVLWVREYKIASMRFDLMGHQPREAMERLQRAVDAAAGRPVQLLGEGWNFGEVANGARFVQASQLSLNGSGIGSFSDRARDAARGGGAGEGGDDSVRRQGWLNGMGYAPNALGDRSRNDLLNSADLIRVGLAGSLRGYELTTWTGEKKRLEQLDYAGQPAGFVSQPGEVVNYTENHDNQTLFDVNALKLPLATSREDRARVQALGAALVAFSQGIAYFHAGQDILRSKSMDRNSYDSGDWFNRLDWTYLTNHFGTGLPPRQDNFGQNGRDWALAKERLARAAEIAPGPAEIQWSRDVFRDLLKIRASTPLLRLASAAEIEKRLSFPGSGKDQNPVLIATRIDGRGLKGFKAVMTLINVSPEPQRLSLPDEAGAAWRLHPVQRQGADARVAKEASAAAGVFSVPARSAAVFVVE
ncbi:alpha-1,6-glucosidase domain-containing protein [Roseateles asaccharophilus]|uniref:Pullulanase/glycogen debranching enzyme n=1 Tax=Roseateles asaccharophilus TaxID=582607 RepID=A0ABU2A567_9BURK|nr:alpha-1,6-glucosidase domain-containing protein [Roseateles asaccharophilus]MDR7332339.1 pullulanase/glycogen debranching enzyme [Roseateles asaccharophilus]